MKAQPKALAIGQTVRFERPYFANTSVEIRGKVAGFNPDGTVRVTITDAPKVQTFAGRIPIVSGTVSVPANEIRR